MVSGLAVADAAVQDAGARSDAAAGPDAAAKPDAAAVQYSQDKLLLPDRVRALLQQWLNALNQGDFAAYKQLYAESFEGVQISEGQQVVLNRAKWIRDRQRMFKQPMRVTVSNVQLFYKEYKGLWVTLEQTFESGTNREREEKTIRLARSGEGFTILAEEIRTSTKLGSEVPSIAASSPVVPEVKFELDKLKCPWGDSVMALDYRDLLERECQHRSVACTDLAGAHLTGCGGPKDSNRAIALYEKTCTTQEQGCTELAHQLITRNGPGDFERAIALYEKACVAKGQGCKELAEQLIHRQGTGDIARGLKLLGCENAAAPTCKVENESDADLLRKTGLPQYVRRALDYYEKKCDGPDEIVTMGGTSCLVAADIYDSGELGHKDRKMAKQFRKAAKEAEREKDRTFERACKRGGDC